MMKSFKELEKADSKSTDIFNKDMLTTFYPKRPKNLENMSLKDYASNYERVSGSTKPKLYIELDDNNGIMKKRPHSISLS